jgi:hypothetical protein
MANLDAKIVPTASIDKSDTRRDWALMLLSGGGMVMTGFAALCLYMLQDRPGFVFYMGMAAMIEVLVVLTGLTGLLVKRELKISRGEISISDFDRSSSDLIPRPAAEKAVEEAVAGIPGVEVPASGVPTKEGNNDSTDKPG